MERKTIVLVILISVIVVVIASFIIPLVIKMPQPGPGQNPVRPPQADNIQQPARQPSQPREPEENQNLKTVISFINIGLIIPLFVIYAGIYRRMRSSFTLGLMAVIFALGMYAVTSNPLIVSILGGRTGEIGLFQIVPDLCATIALVILVRISLE
jgi:tellurite resistance protein TehA-like permease